MLFMVTLVLGGILLALLSIHDEFVRIRKIMSGANDELGKIRKIMEGMK